MTDEEKIEKAAEEYAANNYVDIFNGDRGYDSRDDVAETFKVAVKWRDENPGWIDIKKQLPEPRKEVEILYVINKEWTRGKYYRHKGGGWFTKDGCYLWPGIIVFYWKELTALPPLPHPSEETFYGGTQEVAIIEAKINNGSWIKKDSGND